VTLTPLLVLSAASLLIGLLAPKRWRTWLILASSLVAIFWLQPSTPIRYLDFWLPALSVLLTILVWSITQAPQRFKPGFRRAALPVGLAIAFLILAVGITRYLGPFCCLTQTRPPELWRILAFLSLGMATAIIPILFATRRRSLAAMAIIAIVLILGIFLVLKSESLGLRTSAWLRTLAGQPIDLASPSDLVWLGFSFLAFRLLHTLLDFRSGKLPQYSLGEFVTYVLFFPAVVAGPIDRSQRFIGDLREPKGSPCQNLFDGGERILVGVFKKFVLADSLALVALNSQNATQVNSSLWMWVIVYAYALRIYFDFAGYTDVAIGLGRLMGIKLPENFDRPYLKQNLTAFWNSWHITLAQWFRAYYFNPLTRALRLRPQKLPTWLIILAGQMTTMLLIGLWHGLTWNFAAWGAWHGLGLFIHNRWLDWSRARLGGLEKHPNLRRALQFGGWFVTFNYVALGWVFFAMPTLKLSGKVFLKLAGN
jgi:alginate O-acetyltransferase complex protein AlgI